MRFEDEIYFSRNYTWSSIDVADPLDLIDKFEDRVRSIYLSQAHLLISDQKNSTFNAFSVGIILFCAIDLLGLFLTPKKGFKNRLDFFLNYSNEFKALDENNRTAISKTVVDCFRNGIVHSGRVKEACQFDVHLNKTLFVKNNGILVVNALALYNLVTNVLSDYIMILKRNDLDRQKFVDRFKVEFETELIKLI
jgi:hypothetical protein